MTKTVFVVDDEQRIADTLVAILNNNGYRAIAFYDAQSALNKVPVEHPELVISDVVMPGMSGTEMAVLITELCPQCKILLFSGQAATADLLRVVREKGYNFELLAKPVHPADLLAKVGKIGQSA